MGKKKDITKQGPFSYKDLQRENASEMQSVNWEEALKKDSIPTAEQSLASTLAVRGQVNDYLSQSSIMQSSGGEDYWGSSFFDDDVAVGSNALDNLGDIRAENQPWFSKILNGVGKAAVNIVTTAAELGGIIYGIGQGTANAIEGDKTFWEGLWDNPVTNALKDINDFAEKWMPNYYTRDEQENPWSHFFNANWIGDKLIKNIGFMIGAYYGGIPVSKGLGAVGTKLGTRAEAIYQAEKAGMGARASQIAKGYGDDVIKEAEALGNEVYGVGSEKAAELASKYSTEARKLHGALDGEKLTAAERAAREQAAMDRVRRIAQTTRTTTQAVGSFVSAVNEGAIEALNNSRDWEKVMQQEEDARYEARLQELEEMGLDDDAHLIAEREEHDARLAEIAKGRASMGNADLLMNLPILWLSNAYQLGRLYSRGFGSAKKQIGGIDKFGFAKKNASDLDKLGSSRRATGGFWNGNKLKGKAGTLASRKNRKKAVLDALYKSNTEGLEEFLQRAASDGAGEAVKESINRYFDSPNDEEAHRDMLDFIEGFGKAAAKNLGDPNAWEEYFIGAISSAIGMPVFGSQTRNATFGKGKKIGLAGGVIGNYRNYMEEKAREDKIAEYINDRVNNPDSKFKPLYEALVRNGHLDKLIKGTLDEDDKAMYKELKWEKLFNDIDAFAAAGRLSELKELIGYNKDYTDAELNDVIKTTTKVFTKEEQRKEDLNRLAQLRRNLASLKNKDSDEASDIRKEIDELREKTKSLDNYKERKEGPFIDASGEMNVTDPEKMREILTKNRNYLLNSIDDIIKARNDIDIETDGRLDDKQIRLLTQMRAKVMHLDRRSAEMAYDLADALVKVKNNQEEWRDGIVQDREKAEEELNAAKDELQEAEDNGKDKETIKKKKAKVKSKEDALTKAKYVESQVNSAIELLDAFTKLRDMEKAEKKGYNRGYDSTGNSDYSQRKITAEEAQALLSHPGNFLGLARLLRSDKTGLEKEERSRLMSELIDLVNVSHEKKKYNEELMKAIGHPEYINKIKQDRQNEISKEEKEQRTDELTESLKNVTDLATLDQLMREGRQVNREIAEAAFKRAVAESPNEKKAFLEAYDRAFNHWNNIMLGISELKDEETKIAASDIVNDAWDYAMSFNGSDLYTDFVNKLDGLVSALMQDSPAHQKTGQAIKNIIKDLKDANNSVANGKATNNKGKNKREEASPESLRKARKQKEDEDKDKDKDKSEKEQEDKDKDKGKGKEGGEGKEGSKEGDEETEEEDKDLLMQDIAEAINKAADKSEYIDKISSLPEELRKRVEKYNENKDEEAQIKDSDIQYRLQEIVNSKINNEKITVEEEDSEQESDFDYNSGGSSRSANMKAERRSSYISDYIAEFLFKKEGPAEEYEAEGRQKVLQDLLKDLRAYDFVNSNLLGYLSQHDDYTHPVLNILKSTDIEVDGNEANESILFLALEWNDKIENTICKQGFGSKDSQKGKDVIRKNTNLVTVGGKRYQIVGVVSYDGEANQDIKDGFASLQAAVNAECNPKKDEARNNNESFVVSKFTVEVDNIYTGRLNGSNDAQPAEEVFDSYETEIKQGGAFFGVVVGEGVQFAAEDDGRVVLPNPQWKRKHNGAVLLYLPRPDGKMYPIRMERKTVDNGHIALFKEVIDGTKKNTYIQGIIDQLKVLFDEDAEWGKKMEAKYLLSKYFILDASSIYFSDEGLTLRLNDSEYTIEIDRDNNDPETINGLIESILETFKDEGVMFSVPSPTIIETDPWEVIQAGVLNTHLSGPSNYNANFTIRPIDGSGNEISVVGSSGPVEGGVDGGSYMRGNDKTYDIGHGTRTYTILGDGTVIDKETGEVLSDDEQNLVTIAAQAEEGKLDSITSSIVTNMGYTNPKVIQFILDNITEFDKVYVIETASGERWIYDGRKEDHNKRLVKEGSEEGQKIISTIEEAITKFALSSKGSVGIYNLQKEKGAPSTSDETPSAQDYISRIEASEDMKEVDRIYNEAIKAGVPEKDIFPTYTRRQAALSKKKKENGKKENKPNPPLKESLDDYRTDSPGLMGVLCSIRNMGKQWKAIANQLFSGIKEAEKQGHVLDHKWLEGQIENLSKEKNKKKASSILNDILKYLNCGK